MLLVRLLAVRTSALGVSPAQGGSREGEGELRAGERGFRSQPCARPVKEHHSTDASGQARGRADRASLGPQP